MPQINTRLATADRTLFGDYAKSLGLDAAELARLLIVRELRTRRTLRLKRPLGAKAPKAAESGKLTAHFHRPDVIAEFDHHARTCGFTRSAAAKFIFERELNEKWLAKAFSWTPKRS